MKIRVLPALSLQIRLASQIYYTGRGLAHIFNTSEVRSITKIDSVKNKLGTGKQENISYENETAVGMNKKF